MQFTWPLYTGNARFGQSNRCLWCQVGKTGLLCLHWWSLAVRRVKGWLEATLKAHALLRCRLCGSQAQGQGHLMVEVTHLAAAGTTPHRTARDSPAVGTAGL